MTQELKAVSEQLSCPDLGLGWESFIFTLVILVLESGSNKLLDRVRPIFSADYTLGSPGPVWAPPVTSNSLGGFVSKDPQVSLMCNSGQKDWVRGCFADPSWTNQTEIRLAWESIFLVECQGCWYESLEMWKTALYSWKAMQRVCGTYS